MTIIQIQNYCFICMYRILQISVGGLQSICTILVDISKSNIYSFYWTKARHSQEAAEKPMQVMKNEIHPWHAAIFVTSLSHSVKNTRQKQIKTGKLCLSVAWYSPSWWTNHGNRSWRQLATLHLRWRSKERWTLYAQLAFCFPFNPRPQPMEWCHLQWQGGLPTSVNLIRVIPLRHAQNLTMWITPPGQA